MGISVIFTTFYLVFQLKFTFQWTTAYSTENASFIYCNIKLHELFFFYFFYKTLNWIGRRDTNANTKKNTTQQWHLWFVHTYFRFTNTLCVHVCGICYIYTQPDTQWQSTCNSMCVCLNLIKITLQELKNIEIEFYLHSFIAIIYFLLNILNSWEQRILPIISSHATKIKLNANTKILSL